MNNYERMVVYLLIVLSIAFSFQNDKAIQKVNLDLISHEISHPLFFQISENKCQRCGSNAMNGSMLRDCDSASFFCADCGYRFADMKLHKFYSGPDRDEIFLKKGGK